MATIVVKNDLIDYANTFINAKSTYDDISAGLDILEISRVIDAMCLDSESSIYKANQLHETLNSKYGTIAVISSIVDTFERLRNIFPTTRNKQYTQKEIVQSYIDSLKIDRMGIWADVLIKHGVIKHVKDIIYSLNGEVNIGQF